MRSDQKRERQCTHNALVALSGAAAHGLGSSERNSYSVPIQNCVLTPCENSEIGDSDESFHFVFLAGREVDGKIGDVARFNADHLNPFVVSKI